MAPDDGTGVQTLYENFEHGLKVNPNGRCFGHRPIHPKDPTKAMPYVWQTYREIGERRTHFGSGLLHLYETHVDGTGDPGWRLGFYSMNRPEWAIADQACNAYSLVNVSLYDTLGPDTAEYTLNHSEISVLVASLANVSKLLELSSSVPKMRIIISMDPLVESVGAYPGTAKVLHAWARDRGILLVDFNHVEELGRQHLRPHRPPGLNDVCTICYTSGTLGTPKGAIVLHRNFAYGSIANTIMVIPMEKEDVHISYLPLAHCMERLMFTSVIRKGASVGFSRGDPLLLLEDVAALKPTLFISVPRLYNRIYDRLVSSTVQAGGLLGMVARKAVEVKLANLRAGQGVHHALWDRVLFNKVRQVMGGRVRIFISGSAPLSTQVVDFLQIAFCAPLHEGYGQTENAGSASFTVKGESRSGHVGAINLASEIKLVDLPELSYLSTDSPSPRGEVCIRGQTVFSGYLKDQEKTNEALDDEGWLHTGDVGTIETQGTLKIIDRKKNIFKLAQGEYVAPENIENVYSGCPLIAQIFVHGDSLENALVAVVIPDTEVFLPWARDLVGKPSASLEDLCEDEAVERGVIEAMNVYANAGSLNGYEKVKALRLDVEEFTMDNGLLTPTFKLKRSECVQKYRGSLDAMYAQLKGISSAEGAMSKL
ncbi:hypothetical protein BJ684DRAFT_20819 [Piptocephalis cylindrospora]|uniref:AMP-dependent synthetase/ligase domain-containing protein n=1 Tax=Piptocephalis cylindrospora TaxID=1907219 RepID=A0A4P9Y1W7_9FUNG|nr:hypothetical protein BJ684DRAFT_20819 [Piptocephalis cylindrospora]|eukprot:RKP12654.1 hypothetical protein BJ684DRAFT_20819 [Piptocephalis cylindrospora]